MLEDDTAAKQSNAKLARLASWAVHLEDYAYVVELQVPRQMAHKIFETLNTRGLRLSNGDLVKSYLLAGARNHAAAEHVWGQVITALSDKNGSYEATLDDSLYHYYGSRYDKVVRKEPLFGAFVKRVKNEDPLDVLEDLRVSAELYAGLVHPFDAPALASHSDDAKYSVQFMNGIRFRQLRFLLLAVLRDFPDGVSNAKDRRELQSDLVRRVASWSIRGLVTGRVGGQTAQSVYVLGAKAMREGTAKDWKHVRKLFLNKQLFVTTRRAFEREFVTWRFDTAQGRALLVELERAELGTKAAMKLKGDLTLEHVLPRRPRAGTWGAFTGADRTVYPHRVGNFLLLAQPFNSSLEIAIGQPSGRKSALNKRLKRLSLSTH